MSEKKEIKNYDDAWKRLLEITDSMKEATIIARTIRDHWLTDTPNIEVAYYKEGKPESYKSTLEGFPSMLFATELEANLANAIYLIYKAPGKEFRRDRFEMTFSLVLTLLDIESDWKWK